MIESASENGAATRAIGMYPMSHFVAPTVITTQFSAEDNDIPYGLVCTAEGMAVNMAIVLRDAVEIYGGEHAQAKIIAKSILRYVIVVIVFFVMMKFNLGNLFTAFIGVLGLKISAYLQPFTHKFVLKLQGRVETPSESSDN